MSDRPNSDLLKRLPPRDSSHSKNQRESQKDVDPSSICEDKKKVEFLIGPESVNTPLINNKDVLDEFNNITNETLFNIDKSGYFEDQPNLPEDGLNRNLIPQNLFKRIRLKSNNERVKSNPKGQLVSNNGKFLNKLPSNFVQLDCLVANYQNSSSWAWQETNRWFHYEEKFDNKLGYFSPPFTSPLLISSILRCEQLFKEGVIVLNPEITRNPATSAYDVDSERVLKPEELITLFSQIIDLNSMSANDALLLKLVFFAPPRIHGRHLFRHHDFIQFHKQEDKEKHSTQNFSAQNRRESIKKFRSFFSRDRMSAGNIHQTNNSTDPELNQIIDEICGNSCNDLKSRDFLSSKDQAFSSSKENIIKYWSRESHEEEHLSNLESRVDKNTEAVAIHLATINGLEKICFGFIRLQKALYCQNMTELDKVCPVRFIILLFGPPSRDIDMKDICRVIGSLFVDKIFRNSAYKAENRADLIRGIHKYSDQTILLPLNAHLNETTIHAMSSLWRRELLIKMKTKELTELELYLKKSETNDNIDQNSIDLLAPKGDNETFATKEPLLPIKGSQTSFKDGLHLEKIDVKKDKVTTSYRCNFRPFRNLYHDVRGLHERWGSDFRDIFVIYRNNYNLILSSIIFMFSVLLAPCLTFGSLLNDQVDQRLTIYSALLGTGLCQVLFTLLCGQPLLIVGISGPTFIIEICITLITNEPVKKLPILRFQVAVACFITTIILISLNITRLASYVRRSLEEIFNFFICIYFIFKASKTIFKDILTKTDPISLSMSLKSLFLAIFMLTNCMFLSYVKTSSLLRRSIRNGLGFANVPIGLALCTLIDYFIFKNVNTAYYENQKNYYANKTTSESPNSFEDSLFKMPFLNDLMMTYPSLTTVEHASAIGIGVCLSLTIFTESVLSGLTVAKAERKLRKPCLFAMDYVIAGSVLPLISGIMFWPFLSCNPVKSNANVISLTIWDIKTMPGVPHKVLGCVEQRITNIAIGILLSLTVLINQTFFDLIPTGALLGIFVYMGIMGLRSLIITKRLSALIKRRKYWNDKEYVSQYPNVVLYSFVFLQLFFIIILISLNIVTELAKVAITSLLFPVILFIYALTREVFLPTFKSFSPYLDRLDKYHEIPQSGFFGKSISQEEAQMENVLRGEKRVHSKSQKLDPPSAKASWADQDERILRLIEMNTQLLSNDEDEFEDNNVESRLNNPFNVY